MVFHSSNTFSLEMFSNMMIKPSFFQFFLFLGSNPESFGTILLSRIDGSFSLGLSLRQCVLTIGSHFFDLNKDIINLGNRKSTFKSELDIDSTENFKWTFYSADLHFLSQIFHCYDKNYLLEVDSYEEAASAFKVIKRQNCWNPNQKVFLFSSVISENQTGQFFRMVGLIEKQMLNNVIVMLPARKKRPDLQIYYWASKDNEKCGKKAKYSHYFSCRFGHVWGFHGDNEVTPVCSLRVKAIVWPPFVWYKGKNTLEASDLKPVEKPLMGGLEIELMNLVSELLGIDVEYFISMKEDWGRSFFNGTTTKSMEDLTTRRVDIVIGSLTVTLPRYLLFGTSVSYIEETLVCCVSSDGHFDMWSTLFDTSSLEVYLSIYLIYVLITPVVWITAQFNEEEFQIYKRGPTVFLYTFAAFIGNSVSVLPKTRRVRMLFLMILIFQFFYVAFYQSLLTSILSTQKFHQEIKTIGDVLKRNMNIYNQPENHRYLEFQRSKMGDMVSKHWLNCENTTKCLENLYKTKKEAICLGSIYKDYILQNSEREERPPLYCFNQKVLSYPVVMVMRKSLPFRNKIDEIIGRAIASGLVNKWKLSLFYNSTKQTFATPKVIFGILGYSHLKPVFVLVGIGLGFAGSVLVAEKLFYSFFQKK